MTAVYPDVFILFFLWLALDVSRVAGHKRRINIMFGPKFMHSKKNNFFFIKMSLFFF